MMNAEQAELEAEQRFPEYRAEATCTCGVYKLAFSPKLPGPPPSEPETLFELTDPRLYSEGSSYEDALAAAKVPPVADLARRR
jgi:hypothetical protein